MSSIVCQQRLHSSLVEPRTFELKLAPPKPVFLHPNPTTFNSISSIEDHCNKTDVDANETKSNVVANGGWDFIQALENSSRNYINEAKNQKETPYVHPLVKRYSSKLSEKSLELCTENLGCETGSDIGEFSDVYSNSSSDSEDGKDLRRDQSSIRRNLSLLNKKKKVIRNLPPPLTSISGSNCVQVRPHREGGRLVITTVLVPSSRSCFKAERRDGRLRLHFVNNCDSSAQAFKDEQQHEHQEEVEETHNNEEEEENPEVEDDAEAENETETKVEVEPETEEAETEEKEEEEEDIFGEEDTDGNDFNDRGKMGIKMCQRPSRCKEGGRGKNGLLIWEPFWVAT